METGLANQETSREEKKGHGTSAGKGTATVRHREGVRGRDGTGKSVSTELIIKSGGNEVSQTQTLKWMTAVL